MKTYLCPLILFLCLTTAAQAQKSPKPAAPKADTSAPAPPRVFAVQGTVEAFRFLLYALDNPTKTKSIEVAQLKDWITEQLERQMTQKEQPK